MARAPKEGHLPLTPPLDDQEQQRRLSEERDRLEILAEEEWKSLTRSEREQRLLMRQELGRVADKVEEHRLLMEQMARAKWDEEAPIRAREAAANEIRRLEQLERDKAAEKIRLADEAEKRRLQAEAIAEATERARWRPPLGKSLHEQVDAYKIAIRKVLDHGPATKEVVRAQLKKNLPRYRKEPFETARVTH